MAGEGDGLAQVLPFKKHLYDQYTEGEFFYSVFFGLGSGTFSGLSYYYSTSIVFILTVIAFYLLELIGVIQHPDLLFWAHAAVFISIFRLTAVLVITHLVFRYLQFARLPAFLGAAVYGLSVMYFRHTVFWEFFADAYLWLPLLVLGTEKIFRERKPGWFIFAAAISMIDNFYFAYINFILIGIYLLFRFFMPLEENESGRKKALSVFVISGLMGAGISAISFIPAVYAFFNNHRPSFPYEVAWFDLSDSILFTSRFVILPAITVFLLFAFPLYNDRRFRFFAVLVIAGVILHYSPVMASMLNGFSAPRYRWEYFLSFAAGGVAAAGTSRLSMMKGTSVVKAGLFSAVAYLVFAAVDQQLEGRFFVFLAIIGAAFFSFMLFRRAAAKNTSRELAVLCTGIVLVLTLFSNSYQQAMITATDELEQVTDEFIQGPHYNDPEIRRLLVKIEEREGDSFYRIDWMEGYRNNIPLVQDFRGVSAYASLLNEELLRFYLYELEIDMGRESISRYATLGRRANLHSLLKTDYVILEQDNQNVPYGFRKVESSDQFAVYENQNRLSFVRGPTDVFSEKQLENEPILRREQAMLSGVILKNPENPSPLPSLPEKLSFAAQETKSTYDQGILEVTGETGGIDLLLDKPVPSQNDLYVSFHLEHLAPDDGFPLLVNSYRTTRKPNKSLYRTYVDDLTIRVPGDEKIRIRMPKGTYKLTEIAVFEENYGLLRAEAEENQVAEQIEWNGSRLHAQYNNDSGADFLTLPVPYEKGWQAKVNGIETEVLEANYAFVAVPAKEGDNKIVLTYRPPYWHLSFDISFFSILLAIVYIWQKRLKSMTGN